MFRKYPPITLLYREKNPGVMLNGTECRFNGGPRICPGQTFSLAEATYILTRLAQEFKAVERRDQSVRYKARIGLATSCRLGCKVALTKA